MRQPEGATPAPRPVTIVAEDSDLAAWSTSSWPFGVSGPPFETRGEPWQVVLARRDTDVPDTITSAEWLAGSLDTCNVLVGDDEFWVLHPGSSTAARLVTDRSGVLVEVHGSDVSGPALVSAFYEAIGLAGAFVLHAAAITRGQEGVLLLGPGGRGKTTTMLRAVANGWRPVAEDLCWLDPHGLCIVGSDLTIGVRAESVPFAEDLGDLVSSPAGDKFFALWPTADRRPVTLTDVVELRRDADHVAGFAPIAGSRAAMSLFAAAGIPRTRALRDLLASSVGAVARQVRARTLQLDWSHEPF